MHNAINVYTFPRYEEICALKCSSKPTVTWRFGEFFFRLSQKIDPLLNLLGKMNFQTPCWINWTSFDRYAGCFNFSFFSGCWPYRRQVTSPLDWNNYNNDDEKVKIVFDKLTLMQIVNKLSFFDWSKRKEFARCANGVVHARHFLDILCKSTWSFLRVTDFV